jgi:hypothetical protein
MNGRYTFHLISQNRALVRELNIYKSKLEKCQNEIEQSRDELSKCTSSTALIGRYWSQVPF